MVKPPDKDDYITVGVAEVIIRHAGQAPRHVFAEVAVPLSAYVQSLHTAPPMDAYDQFGRPYSFDVPDNDRGFTI